jgi:hypothetical protein
MSALRGIREGEKMAAERLKHDLEKEEEEKDRATNDKGKLRLKICHR